jgi:hypothetical protein
MEGPFPPPDDGEGIVPVDPPSAEDFFEWETEMPDSENESFEPTRTVKVVGGFILLMVLAFVVILLGKAIEWAWNL